MQDGKIKKQRIFSDIGGERRAQLLRVVSQAPESPRPLSQMARSVGMSDGHFTRCFAALTGTSPMAYRAALRHDLARRMLRDTALPVTEIAAALGVSSPAYFTAGFTAREGCSPTVFRRQVTDPAIHIYLCRIDREDTVPEGIFPFRRQEEIASVRHPAVRAEKIAVWRLLGRALVERYTRVPAEISFSCNAAGKWEADGLFFSLSHSEGVAAVALADRTVGVDIQGLPLRRCDAGFAARILTEEEKRMFTALAPEARQEYLAAAWCAKESAYKRVGEGAFLPREIAASPAGIAWLTAAGKKHCLAWQGTEPSRVRFHLPDSQKNEKMRVLLVKNNDKP